DSFDSLVVHWNDKRPRVKQTYREGSGSMSLDLAAIVRQLQDVEARHPETVGELDPIIRALSSPEESLIGTEHARKLLGVRSVNTVKRWLELGILAGRW